MGKKIIEKRAWPEFFEDILAGRKRFDLRLADFECEAGDILLLREWNPETQEYTGRFIRKEVDYILKTKNLKFWLGEEINKFGFQVLSFKPLPERGDTHDGEQ